MENPSKYRRISSKWKQKVTRVVQSDRQFVVSVKSCTEVFARRVGITLCVTFLKVTEYFLIRLDLNVILL